MKAIICIWKSFWMSSLSRAQTSRDNACLLSVINSAWDLMWTDTVFFQSNNTTWNVLIMPMARVTIMICKYLHFNWFQVIVFLDHYILYASIALGQISLLRHIANALVVVCISSFFPSFRTLTLSMVLGFTLENL